MLLYLNAETAEAWPGLQAEVEATLREGGPGALLLLHEQREGKNAVSFDAIIRRTPTLLRELGVYRFAALPIHESSPGVTLLPHAEAGSAMNEHLAVSLRLALLAACGASIGALTARFGGEFVHGRTSSTEPRNFLYELSRRARTAAASVDLLRPRLHRTSIGDESSGRLESRELMPVSARGASPASGRDDSALVIDDRPRSGRCSSRGRAAGPPGADLVRCSSGSVLDAGGWSARPPSGREQV